MKRLALAAVIFAFGAASCLEKIDCIDGNNIVISDSRQVNAFSSLVNTTSVDVIYMKADSISVRINAESNIAEHIVTSVYGGRLEIRTDPRNSCFDFNVRPVITVTSPSLTEIDITGSGSFEGDSIISSRVDIRCTGSGNLAAGFVSSDNLKIGITGSGDADILAARCSESDFTLTGSGNLDISGNSSKATMRVTGSGDIKSESFAIMEATETISGSGNIYTRVTNKLNAVISGSGNIYVRGNPSINQTLTGSGRVINL